MPVPARAHLALSALIMAAFVTAAMAAPPAPKGRNKAKTAISPAEKPPSGGRLRVQTEFSNSLWDWNHDGHRIPRRILEAIHRGLYRISKSGQLEPDLVESESASIDARVWRFRLRSDATWSDGTPFTAADAALGLQRACEPSAVSPPRSSENFLGCREFHVGQSPSLSGVTAESRHVLKVELRDPDPSLPYKLTDPRAFPAPSHLVSSRADYGLSIPSMAFLGKWKVANSRPLQWSTLLPSRPESQDETAKIREIELWSIRGGRDSESLFERNHLDVLTGPLSDTNAPGVRTRPRTSVVTLKRLKRFEKSCPAECMLALSGSIRREKIAQLRPARGQVPPELWDAQRLGEDPTPALLAASQGAVTKRRAVPKSVRLGISRADLPRASDLALLRTVGRSISADLKRNLGISVQIVESPAAECSSCDLSLEIHEAYSLALDDLLSRVEGPSSFRFWSEFSGLPIQSEERLAAFKKHTHAVLVGSAEILPIGFGIDHDRIKPYVNQLPF